MYGGQRTSSKEKLCSSLCATYYHLCQISHKAGHLNFLICQMRLKPCPPPPPHQDQMKMDRKVIYKRYRTIEIEYRIITPSV